MTLSDRVFALSAPDRDADDDITDALSPRGAFALRYTGSVDAALTIPRPERQAHTLMEALQLVFNGSIVGKFTEALAIAICVVALRERGL